MGLGRMLGKLVFVIILINALAFGSYYLYQNLPGELEEFRISDYGLGITPDIGNVSSELRQFYPNMRFNHNNISYFINPECDDEKTERVKSAFSIIHKETGVISFRIGSEEDADILVGCSLESYQKEENIFIAGEGGPTKIVNSSLYPIILRGKVMLYKESPHGEVQKCDSPVTELHELFHVFGFDHINDSTKIMYPYVDCEQKIGEDLIEILINLYSIEALPELYFANISASKSGRYLNFEVLIRNEGMIDASDVSLEVYAEDELVKAFDLGEIEFGAGKSFYVDNLTLPSRSIDKVKLEIKSKNKEIDEENNIIELEI